MDIASRFASTAGLALILCFHATWLAAQQVIWPELAPGHVVARFGESVATNGLDLAIGAPAGDGFVEVYRRTSDGWVSVQRLVPVDTQAYGYRLAISEEWLAIASRDLASSGWPSFIDLYSRPGGHWTFSQRLESPLPGSQGYIARMQLSDSALTIASDSESGRTRTFNFDRVEATWGGVGEIHLPYSSQYTGRAIASNENLLVTSDVYTQALGGWGAVSTFARVQGTWVHASAMSSSVMPPFYYGTGVLLCGGRLIVSVSSYSLNPQSGRVLIYERDFLDWSPMAEIVPSADADYRFGQIMHCNDSTLLVGGDPANRVIAYSLNDMHDPAVLVVNDPTSPMTLRKMAVIGGDVVVTDPSATDVPFGPALGAVYIFLNALDPIFKNGFD